MPEEYLFCSAVGSSGEYDAIGREVARLVDGYKEAGSYDIQVNHLAREQRSYFYRIQAGNYVDMKKMMMMK